MYKRFGKRAIDLLLSGLGLIILFPLFLIISVAIKAEDPGPVALPGKLAAHIAKIQLLPVDPSWDT